MQSPLFSNIPTQINSIIKNNWRGTTQKQYSTYLNKWMTFCKDHNHNAYVTPITTVLEFLHKLYKEGLGYSTLNTAHSALSSFVIVENSTSTVGNHTFVLRFLKGYSTWSHVCLGIGKYGTLNTAHSALSSFVIVENSTSTVGNHTFVLRFLKGYSTWSHVCLGIGKYGTPDWYWLRSGSGDQWQT